MGRRWGSESVGLVGGAGGGVRGWGGGGGESIGLVGGAGER